MKILIRFAGEVAVKSPHVRRQFLSRLTHNIREALKNNGIVGKVQQEWGRIYVESDSAQAIEILKKIYGIRSFSPVDHVCSADMDTILETGKAYLPLVEGKKFAVKARRSGNHEYSSMDLQKRVGAMLNRSSGTVSLSDPDILISLEVRDGDCTFFSQIIKGPGGLPLGTGGKAVCLMSGGFDSPVAAWMMQKRGIVMEYLLCNMAGEAYERSVLRVAKWMSDNWSHGTSVRFHVVDFEDVVKNLKASVTPRYTQVILKRLFYRAADLLARETGAEAVVTGEAIAQVSSQTLTNLGAIDPATDFPVMRPLVAFDKEDIIDLSRKIGTYDFSAHIQEFCQVVPVKPATACKVSVADEEESGVDRSILEKAFADRKILKVDQLTAHEMTAPYIFQDQVPENSVVIDCRTKSEYEKWHYPGAVHHDYYELSDSFRKTLAKEKHYLLYCAVGMQSALLAEKMQTDGYIAYSFQGGSRALQNAAVS